MTNNNQYDINFFRPLSEHARGNKKLISRLAIIWAVAVFGFHFVLIFVTTPTAEKTLTEFNSVWPQVIEDTTATQEMKQVFSRSMLMVLGKNIAVKENHKAILIESLTWMVHDLQPDSLKPVFLAEPTDEAVKLALASIGLKPDGFDKIMMDLLPSSLMKLESASLSSKSKESLAEIMDLYLIHNQSFLTDFKFFGFPFHYWYTAQFLLILFVLLCLVYAVSIDKLNKKHAVVEET